MRIIPTKPFGAIRAVILIAVVLVSSRAQAATIIFDSCSVPSLCNVVDLYTFLQPGGDVTGSFGGRNGGSDIDILRFGINYAPDLSISFSGGAPTAALGPGDIGLFGSYSQRWLGPPPENYYRTLFQIIDPDGPFPNDLAPFFGNGQGFFIAAQIQDNQTGAIGFVAGRLNDVAPVPEPSSILLLGTGLFAAWRARRR